MKDVNREIRNLSSIFPWIRKRALNNLVEIGHPAVKEIIAALDTRYAPIATQGFNSSKDNISEMDDALRRHPILLDALVKIGNPAITELESALRHSNLNVRVSAMAALGRIEHPSTVDLLLPFLDSHTPAERAWVLYALGNTRSPRVLKRIIAALNDENLDVRESAILALGDFGDTSVLPKLERIASSDTSLVESYGRTIGHVAREAIEKIKKRHHN